jgi:hypothetical protein
MPLFALPFVLLLVPATLVAVGMAETNAAEEADFYAVIKNAVANGQTTKTKLAGGGKKEYTSVPP